MSASPLLKISCVPSVPIGEYKGKQDLFKAQSPQILETLQQAAIIQSTESSIEG